jgi:hypothetical protein
MMETTMDTIRIDPHEPCELCGSTGTTRLHMREHELVVMCSACYATWDAERIAAKEARLLAEWGLMRDKRTA